MQSYIDFLLHNNVTIIQVIFGVIFLLVVFVILRSFKEDKGESAPASKVSSSASRREEFKSEAAAPKAVMPKEDSPLDDLDNLDDLIAADEKEATQAQVDQALAAAGAAGGAAAAGAAAAAPSAELTQALTEKEKVIADLKNEIAGLQDKLKAAPAAGASGDTKALEDKVKELSEKLAEYEIIEDDIANLSFYKSENVKLKNELERLKGVSAAATEAAVQEVTAEPPPPPQIKEPAPPVAAAPVEPPPPPPPAPVAPPEDANAVLNEFEEAVKQKEALEKNMPESSGSTGPIAVANDADLLKEFESVVEKELAEEAKPKANTKPAPPPEAAAAPAPAADENSKLVAEMEALAQAKPPEVADDGKDSNQKLIEEFENFVNKST